MTQSLFSPQWYRVAQLHPRLRAQVSVQRQHWRDQHWYVLSDKVSGRQHRINAAAYQFIGRCDGKRSVQSVWDAVLESSRDNAPTQDEVIGLLAQLHENDLLQCEHTPDSETLFHRRKERVRKRRQLLINPFSFRVPLGDPSRWLARLDPVGRLIFRPAMFWLWLAVMVIAVLAAATEWQSLLNHASVNMLTPRYLALTFLCFPLIKILHELGHALAVRRWGGEVNEVGLGLLVLVPAPYLDASAASAFPERSRRAMVGSAGIMVELALAALALVFWLNVQPGLGRDIAFVVMFIGTVSTLLFNGNPLLRFDAYYVLCDLFDLPNLAGRSATFWNIHLRRLLLRTASEVPPIAAGEHKWLIAYAPLSLVYRLIISLYIILWLGSKWVLLGLLMAVYVLFSMVLGPLGSWARQALDAAAPGREFARARLSAGLLAVFAFMLLFVVPLPFSTVAPAVVWLPEQAQVRAEVDGFIAGLPVRDGETVQTGQVLAVLENPELHLARDNAANKLTALQAEQYQLLLRDPLKAQNLAEEIRRAEAELARAEERLAQLDIRARTSGKLVMPRQADIIGTYNRHGAILGYVLQDADLRVRAAVPEETAFLVKKRTRHAEVRLAEDSGTVLLATLGQDTPAATRQLPSAALGDRGGGPYVTDPENKEGRHSLEPVFLFDLTVGGHPLELIGGRAWVRFDHGAEPLALQLYRRATQLFLKHFEPSQ